MPIPDIDLTMAAASTGGAAATSLVNRSDDTTRRKIADWAAASIVAVFGGPAIADLIGAVSDHARIGIAVACGIVGAIALTKIIDLAKTATLKDVVARILGKPLP